MQGKHRRVFGLLWYSDLSACFWQLLEVRQRVW